MTLPLHQRTCVACKDGGPPLPDITAREFLAELKGWELLDGHLVKTYPFRNYHHTMAFVNALAWIAHREDHHPDLHVYYNKVRVEYWTHAVGGLSENDFICAAKVDLEQLAGGARRSEDLAQFEARCQTSSGRLNGWRFDREEANER